MKTPPKVLIGLPTLGSVHTLLAVTIMSWLTQSMRDKNKGVSIYPTLGVCPVDNARNEIVEEFLKSDSTHLFFIDSDTIPPQDALDKLLAHDLDIVSGITPIIEHDENKKNDSSGFYKKWNCVDMDEKFVEPNTGLIPIKGAGSSCILIKRRVFESLQKPWYRFIYKDDHGKDVKVGEDIFFIINSIAAGFTPYADTSIICRHHKSIIW